MNTYQEKRPRAAEAQMVVCQDWIESERGWGIRPDGLSLHLSQEALAHYVSEYWRDMPDDTPDEYSKPYGEARYVGVSPDVFSQIEAAEDHSLRCFTLPRGLVMIDLARE